jgi:mannose-6-phosphate isomerase-like protein (cupin superfamily)
MHIQHIDESPVHERGGQSSYLLLGDGQFGAKHLAMTWVECPPGSEQQAHRHDTQEQVYVIIRGHGVMRVGDEQQTVSAGALVFVPPGSDHSVRNDSDEAMTYISATSPPFIGAALGALYRER